MKCLTILFPTLTCFVSLVICHFYVGMFKKNDLLVAQDRLYKERVPYRIQIAKYGRVFKCPITYLRVVDRLGYGRAPKTVIIRGGLRRKYVVLRIAAYNRPISVNIYVGCENKIKTTKRTTAKQLTTVTTKKPDDNNAEAAKDDGNSTTNNTESGNDTSNNTEAGNETSNKTEAGNETSNTDAPPPPSGDPPS